MITIIPAIDIIGGKCVRLTQGDYGRSTEYGSPLDMARAFEDAGCRRLHLVDLDGARASHIVNYRVLETIATRTGLTIDFGGGVKSDEDLHIAFDCGAAMVTGGSIAALQPDVFMKWLETYGNNRIILGADARDGKIATNGWNKSSNIDVTEFISGYAGKGITKVICTDIACDGTLKGPSIELYKKILAATPELQLIASGGISSIADTERLDDAGVHQAIVGKAIYEGKISLKELEQLNLLNS